MAQRETGRLVESRAGDERVYAYLPRPLPPDPPLRLTSHHEELLHRASLATGRLDAVTALLPDPTLFLYFYVRKEAVFSSQIEGTQSSLSDLLLFENTPMAAMEAGDVVEVSNYVKAVSHGLQRIRGGFPLSSRLLREMHEVLLATGRGSEWPPGEFRQSQNWVGGTRPGNAVYVPPPAHEVASLMSGLEHFLHDRPQWTQPFIKSALAHVQFETIHPFLDGNGRLGRLLVALILCNESVLSEPMLYLSLYFKQHRETYYELLQRVRFHGDWEAWVAFFLQGVTETATQAVQTAQRIRNLFDEDRLRIEVLERRAGNALRVHEHLQRTPITTVPAAADPIGLSQPTVRRALQDLEGLNIVRALPGRSRGVVYSYARYLALLDEGSDLTG